MPRLISETSRTDKARRSRSALSRELLAGLRDGANTGQPTQKKLALCYRKSALCIQKILLCSGNRNRTGNGSPLVGIATSDSTANLKPSASYVDGLLG